jgi:hypothetical protein
MLLQLALNLTHLCGLDFCGRGLVLFIQVQKRTLRIALPTPVAGMICVTTTREDTKTVRAVSFAAVAAEWAST